MSERISILEEIKRGGYEASLITTFNAYLPFYEEVVLRKLIGQGVQHNVLLMDAAQCAQSVSNHPPRLAGRQYSMVPMTTKGAFHPKIILLLGKNRGALLVGSHNLTLSGFGYNRELTNLIRVQGKNDFVAMAAIKKAWQQVSGWVEAQGDHLPKHLAEMVLRIQDFGPWIKEDLGSVKEEYRLLSTQTGSTSLWKQLLSSVEGTADQVLVSGAFFDSELTFLKQIQQDLNPREIHVAIDPLTVKIPGNLDLPGMVFHNAGGLGKASDKDELPGYLHAKSLTLRTTEGKYYLATGSANPSAPAWLQPGLAGNTEIMLLREGGGAEDAARDLGLLGIPDLSPMTAADWATVKGNWESEHRDKVLESTSIGIGLATENGIVLRVVLPLDVIALPCELLDQSQQTIGEVVAKRTSSGFLIELTEKELARASFVRVTTNTQQKMYLIHHQRQIEEASRTGSQRRFRDALASLNTGTPDLETLISCVDKIIFAKADQVNRAANRIKASSTKTTGEVTVFSEGSELSVDLSDTRKSQKKFRLRHSDDLAYLLDVLIYHLRSETEVGVDASHESRDAKGRTEEEQIDADDEEEVQNDGISEAEMAIKTLALCHGKVRSLVTRMVGQLTALKEGTVSFEDVIVRLTGVLAVLRQLRCCDGKVAWVKQGQTTFPLAARKTLLASIVGNLFELPHSILYPQESEVIIAEADELARLRGLVLWLAWDSGTQFLPPKAFNESREERDERFRTKALMVSLVQLVRNDEVVKEEARQSIGPLCSSDMDWLNWIFSADKALTGFIFAPPSDNPGTSTKSGDIIFMDNLPQFGARLVLQVANGKADLAFFDNDRGYRSYIPKAARYASFDQLMA